MDALSLSLGFGVHCEVFGVPIVGGVIGGKSMLWMAGRCGEELENDQID